jgi:O-acetyl-ADP-ribose deacetylase (regulator of RNase III)
MESGIGTGGRGFTTHVGTVAIRVRSEPIETIAADTELDAIVSSDDSMLSMAGGVALAIESLAGSGIRSEVAGALPLAVGTLTVTSGGRSQVKYIFHAITIDANDRVIPTARTVRQLYREVLTRCEALQVERIAIPALATGAARVDSRISAEQLAEAIRAHTLNPTVLQSIVLPIPGHDVFRAFTAALAAPSGDEITADSYPTDQELTATIATSTRHQSVPSHDPPRAEHPRPERGVRAWFSRLRAPEGLSLRAAPTGPSPLVLSTHEPAPRLTVDGHTSRPVLGGRYVLLEEIGRGGMAVVHIAWDLVLRRTVAIKILRPDCADPHSLKREAATAFELTHHGIVRLYHFEPPRDKTDAYLVMEYLSWPSGEKWIADAGEAGLPVRAVQDVGIRVCDALAYAHSRNVLHLDIKPSNIFVDPAGESAKLGDFGLAQISGSGGAALQVRPVGTPAYMAPEQIAVGAKVTAATDVYQVAATLWDFATGNPPRPLSGFVHVGSDREPLLGALRHALAPDPKGRPTAAQLGQLITAAVVT